MPPYKGRHAAFRPPVAVHEIKHDGFRVIARKDGLRVRLYSRPGTI
jgi:ATP-dependent DNA ligase